MNHAKNVILAGAGRYFAVALGVLCLSATQASAAVADMWVGEGRTFQQVAPGKWQEFYKGQKAFDFQEVTRTGDIIHLHDTSRDISVVLSGSQAKVYQTSKYLFAYNGGFVYTVFAYNGGEFRWAGGSKWEEWQGGKKVFSFVDLEPNNQKLYKLYDASRGITVEIETGGTQWRVYSGSTLLWSKAGKWVR
jgi:hypothetical protein